MLFIPSDRRLIVIVIGTIIIVTQVTALAILIGPESTIIWLMLDMASTLLLIGLKGEKE